MFDAMIAAGVPATEHIAQQKFWPDAKKAVKEYEKEISELEACDQSVCKDCTA